MKNDHKICISSPPDRNNLVAEIFFDNLQWAEVNQESESLEIEFYPRPDGKPWKISFSEAVDSLNEAKLKLIGNAEEN